MHGGDEHRGIRWGGGGDLGDVAGLDPEVEFLGEVVGEAAGQVADVVGAAQSAWDSSRRVSGRIMSRSRATCSSMPGRCTLRMTAVPSARQAACAWAREALASGSGSTLLKTSPGSWASSSVSRAWICGQAAGGTRSWSRPSSVVTEAGSMSVRVDRTWPSLTKIGPASSSASRSRRPSWAGSARRAGHPRQPVPGRDPGQLPIPAGILDRPAQRPPRMGHAAGRQILATRGQQLGEHYYHHHGHQCRQHPRPDHLRGDVAPVTLVYHVPERDPGRDRGQARQRCSAERQPHPQ